MAISDILKVFVYTQLDLRYMELAKNYKDLPDLSFLGQSSFFEVHLSSSLRKNRTNWKLFFSVIFSCFCWIGIFPYKKNAKTKARNKLSRSSYEANINISILFNLRYVFSFFLKISTFLTSLGSSLKSLGTKVSKTLKHNCRLNLSSSNMKWSSLHLRVIVFSI